MSRQNIAHRSDCQIFFPNKHRICVTGPQIRALMEGAAEIIVRIIASSPTDFRDVFGEVAYKHLGATNLKAVFPEYAGGANKFRGVMG